MRSPVNRYILCILVVFYSAVYAMLLYWGIGAYLFQAEREGGRIMDVSLLYMTMPHAAEAKRIGKALLEERLVACVNIIEDVHSMYWWNDAITSNTEAICIAKTKTCLVQEVIAKVKALHSYACPCIVAVPISDGNPEFLSWIGHETCYV